MSRHCDDCELDGECKRQKDGCSSCSDGSEKSKEKKIKDIDNGVLNVIDRLHYMNKQYASWDLWDRTKIIDNALSVLKTGYEKELLERFYTEEKLDSEGD